MHQLNSNFWQIRGVKQRFHNVCPYNPSFFPIVQWFCGAAISVSARSVYRSSSLQVVTGLWCDLLPVLCPPHLCSAHCPMFHVPGSHQLGNVPISQQSSNRLPSTQHSAAGIERHSPGEIEFKIFIRVTVNSRLSTDTQ